MKILKPHPLKSGDTVAIAGVSKKIAVEELMPAVELLNSWGLEVLLAENLKKNHHIYSGTDDERLNGFQEMINHPKVKAILCSRGGYGATRIIDQIDFKPLVQHPKWIIGFSDITVLLNCALLHQVEAIHGPMAFQFKDEKYQNSVESLRRILFGEPYEIRIPPHALNITGTAKGPLGGGNLTMLTNMLGTAYELDLSGKILLLEDIEEYVYKIDRMMVHLKRAGKLQNLAGVIVGHFTDMLDNDPPFGKTVYEVILEHVGKENIPVAFGFPTGHEPDNMALFFGRETTLEVTEKGTRLFF